MLELEDSPDLTDDEVGMAIASTESDMVDHLRGLPCPACDAEIIKIKHELRRRKPYHFSRVRLHCAAGHDCIKVFKLLDWRIPDD